MRFPGVHAVATTPAQRLGASSARFPSRISLPGKGVPVGLRIGIFEVCSAFTHITACTLAGSPEVIRCIEGFSHFVTSMTAPTTSGWSIFAGWDFHPLESAALSRRTPSAAGRERLLSGGGALTEKAVGGHGPYDKNLDARRLYTPPHCRADPNRSIISAKSVNREITNCPPRIGKFSGDGNDLFVINTGPQSWHAVGAPQVRFIPHGE